MGELQSLQFSAELAVRLIDAGAEDAKIDGAVRQMEPLTRSAIAACSTLIEWLRPDDRATTTLGDAVPQCLRIAGDDWSLRGIETASDVRTGDARVAKAALRELVVTALLVLTDAQPGALDVSVEAERAGSEIVRPPPGEAGPTRVAVAEPRARRPPRLTATSRHWPPRTESRARASATS